MTATRTYEPVYEDEAVECVLEYAGVTPTYAVGSVVPLRDRKGRLRLRLKFSSGRAIDPDAMHAFMSGD